MVTIEPAGLPAGAGAVWTGGFAFDPQGGSSSPWSSLAPASMTLPELSLCKRGDQTFLTINALALPGEDKRTSATASERGWRACEPRRCRLPTPTSPTGPRSVAFCLRGISKPPSPPRGSGSPRGRSARWCWLVRSWSAPAQPTIRPLSLVPCASSFPPAFASARERRRRPSSGQAQSYWCGARVRASRALPSPDRPDEALILPWTPTSASSFCVAPRTAMSSRSSSTGSFAPCALTRFGSRRRRSPKSSRWPISNTSPPRSLPS